MLDKPVGDSVEHNSSNESVWAKVSRELQLTVDGAYTGVNKAAVHAVENPGQTALTVGAAYAVGLGLAALSKGRITAPLTNIVKLSFGAAFVKDIALNGKEIAGAMADNWQSDKNYQRNRKIVGDAVGPLVVDTALMTVGGKLAHNSYAKAKPALESVKESVVRGLPVTPEFAVAGAAAGGGGRSFTRFSPERVSSPTKMEMRANPKPERAAAEVTSTKPQSQPQTKTEAATVPAEPRKSPLRSDDGSIVEDISLAQRTTGKGKSWRPIIKTSFPPEELDSMNGMVRRIASGESLLHETRGTVIRPDGRKSTRTLAFSLIDPIGRVVPVGAEHARPVNLLSYLATRDGYRSLGVGGQHLDAVVAELRARPGAERPFALMFEIDHTGLRTLPPLERLQTSLSRGEVPAGFARDPRVKLTPEEQLTNLSRLKFYLRHGAEVANVNYKMPNLEDGSLPPLPAHLMFFNLSGERMADGTLRSIVRQIYRNCYELEMHDPLIGRVARTVGRTTIGDALHQERFAAIVSGKSSARLDNLRAVLAEKSEPAA